MMINNDGKKAKNLHDDQVIPALLKNNNKISSPILEEKKENLEPLNKEILSVFNELIPDIPETTLSKIFSKHLSFREEGIDEFISLMDMLFTAKKSEKINLFLSLTMKLNLNLLIFAYYSLWT